MTALFIREVMVGGLRYPLPIERRDHCRPAQCVDGASVTEYLKRVTSSDYDDVQKLANEIGTAIDHKDQAALESYLWHRAAAQCLTERRGE